MEDRNHDDNGSQRGFLFNFITTSVLFRRFFPGKEMPQKKRIQNKIETPTISDSAMQTNFLASDIGAEVMHECGLHSYKNKTIQRLLIEREHGLTPFTSYHKRQIGAGFLPNHLIQKIRFEGKLYCGIFSKEGDYFLSGCQDAKIRIYRPGPRSLIKSHVIPVLQMGWSVLDIALNSDASKMIYTSWSDKLHLCDLSPHGKSQKSLDLQLDTNVKFCIFSAVFSHDDKEILGGSLGGDILVYNLETMTRTFMALGHLDDINSVKFADDSLLIFITGGDDGLCKVWDRRTLSEARPEPVGIFAGHHDGVTFIDAKKDGRCFLSNSKDQTIKLWDMRKFSSTDAVLNTQKEVSRRNWDYRWQNIPEQIFLRMSGDTSVMTYRGHEVRHTLIRARFSPLTTTGQRYIYCGSSGGEIYIYDLLTGRTVSILKGHLDCTRDVHWHPYSPILATSSWDASVGYWTYCEDNLTPDLELNSADVFRLRNKF